MKSKKKFNSSRPTPNHKYSIPNNIIIILNTYIDVYIWISFLFGDNVYYLQIYL